MRRLSWMLVGIGIAVAAFIVILALPQAKATQTGDTYPGWGDWYIYNPTTVDSEDVWVDGSIYVYSTFDLTYTNIFFTSWYDDQYVLYVDTDGTLTASDTTITDWNGYFYEFQVYGTMDLDYCYVSYMWGDTSSWRGGIQIYSNNVVIKNSYIYYGMTGGIYIDGVSATITNNEIFYNGMYGGSTTYCYGIYVKSNGATSTKIDGNYIYNNYYAMYGYMYYGYGIYSEFQSASDKITNNRIYDNGYGTGFAYNYGAQLRLQYSNATVTDDFLANGAYQLYAYGCKLTNAIKNVNFTSYNYYYWTTQSVYSYNSTITFDSCTWYGTYNMGTTYGVYATGPTFDSAAFLTFKKCGFNYTESSSSYTRYFIYSSYTYLDISNTTFDSYMGSWGSGIYDSSSSAYQGSINITDCKMWINSPYGSPYGINAYYSPVNMTRTCINISNLNGAVYGVYSRYGNITIYDSIIDLYDFGRTGSCSNYLVYGYYYSMINITNTTMNMTFLPPTMYSPSYPYFYGVYAYYYSPLNMSGCWLNITVGGVNGSMYPRYPYYYMVYAYQYSNITILNTYFNLTTPPAGYYPRCYGIYSQNYCTLSMTGSSYSVTLWGDNNTYPYYSYYYMFYFQSYSKAFIDNCNFTMIMNWTGYYPQQTYMFYMNSYCNLSINNSRIVYNCYSPYNTLNNKYFIWGNSYSPVSICYSKIWLNNCSASYFYGIYTSYGGLLLDNTSFLATDMQTMYTMYYFQIYAYDKGNLNMTWSKLIARNDTGINYYTNKNCYGIYLYNGGCGMENSTIDIDFQSQAPWQTWTQGPETSAPYAIYGYLFWAQSTQARTYYMMNNYLKFNMTNQSAGGYGIYWNGYISSQWANCYINITHSATGTSTFVSQMSGPVTWTMDNVTVDYLTKIPNYGVGGCMFSVFQNTYLYAYNSSFLMRNDGGLFTFNMFRYMGGSKCYFYNSSLEYNIGGGDRTIPAEARAVGWIGYSYGAFDTLMLTNSTFTFTVRTEPVILNAFHFRGSANLYAFESSKVIFNINAPGTIVNQIYFDPSYAGTLGKLSLKNSTIAMNINAQNVAADAFTMSSSTTGVSSFEIVAAQFNISVNVATTALCSGLNITAIKDMVLSDFKVNIFGPSLSVDPTGSTQVAGVRLERSYITMNNFAISGNAQGKTYGVLCDIVSRPFISNTTINNCYAGVYSQMVSMPQLSGCLITNCTYGVSMVYKSNGTMVGTTIISKTAVALDEEAYMAMTDCLLTSTVNSIDLNGVSTAWLLNTTFDKPSVIFRDATSTLIVNWLLQMTVSWQKPGGGANVPIPGAEVRLMDSFGNLFSDAFTDDTATIPYTPAIEYIQVGPTQVTSYSPYKANASSEGFSSITPITLDKTKAVALVITDDSNPTVAIITPEDGIYQNFTTVIVTGVASDQGSGLSMLNISYNGPGTVGESIKALGAWVYAMELPEGYWTITVRVTDRAGNEASDSRTIHIDLTAPAINILSPADNNLGNVIGVDLTGNVELGSVLTINHRPVNVTDGAFTYGVRLVEGSNTFNFFARDLAGNTNTTSWTLWLDITPPMLVVTAPVDGLITNQTTVMVIGSTEIGADLKVNNVPVVLNDDGTFAYKLTLTLGTNMINVTSTDKAKNTAMVVRTILMDNELNINIISPTENMFTNQITLLVRGVIDTDSLLRLNDGIVAIGQDGSFTITFSLGEGTNELVFSAADRAGNTARVVRHVILDTVLPPLDVTSPEQGKVYKTRDITVKGTCEAGINLTINGQTVATDTGSFSLSVNLPEGSSMVEVIGTDAAGNKVTVRVPVIIDLSPPTLEIVEPLEGFRTSELTVTVVGITEPGATVKVNGVQVAVDAFGKFSTSVTMQSGKNTITVTAADAAGNEAPVKTVNVKVNQTTGKVTDNSWWWTIAGLLVALGIGFPLTMLFVNMGLKTRKEG